jgi:hypothetical protein
MLKKSLIFGSVALFLAALITLTGCPTSADDGSSTTIVYGNRIFGVNVDPYQAQEAIDNAVKAGQRIVLEHNLIIRPGQLNFRNAEVRINGNVTFNGGVMNMADARVIWTDGATLRMDNGFYIHRWNPEFDFAHKVIGTAPTEVWFVESVETIQSTATHAAVRNFTLGDQQNFDYSQDSNGIDARISAASLDTLFVVGKLAIPGPGVTLPTVTVWAMGEMDVTGTIPADVEIGGDELRLGSCATLTSSGIANITVDNAILIPNVRLEANRGITVTQIANGRFDIGGELTGPGTLTVASPLPLDPQLGPFTDIFINGGDGNINIVGAGARQLQIFSTGRAAIADTVTINAPSNIQSTVVFGDNVTVGAPLEFNGDVILGNEQTITFSSPITLKKGKTISVQIIPTRGTQTPTLASLLTAAGGDVLLTSGPGGGGSTTLRTEDSPRDNTPENIAAAKRIFLETDPLTITNGTLQVVPGAVFEIRALLSTAISGTLGTFGYLSVAEGGALDLDTGNFDIGGGGGITVVNSPFNFRASGGSITLGNNTIAGSAAGTKLTPERGSTGVITVNNTLTLESLEFDAGSYSSITLDGIGDLVALDKGAKIILTAGEGGQPTTGRSTITAGDGSARLTGGFVGLTPDPKSDRQSALSVAHQPGEPAVNITSLNNNPVVLGKAGRTVFDL